MFVNCYDGYGFCRFSVRIKEGVTAELLGSLISRVNELIYFWCEANEPEGVVVRF
jgi:hypothetical protein